MDLQPARAGGLGTKRTKLPGELHARCGSLFFLERSSEVCTTGTRRVTDITCTSLDFRLRLSPTPSFNRLGEKPAARKPEYWRACEC